MSRLIDRALLLAGLAAHVLSLTVGAVLTASMAPIVDALDHVLKIQAMGREG